MSNVIIDMSMSLDGYIAAPNDYPGQGLGEDGMRLHNWAFDDPSVFEKVYGTLVEDTGAVIMGRRTYDNSVPEWGGTGPLGGVPCFVVTHRPLTDAGLMFTVVTEGIETALAKAHEAAGGKRIGIMGANLDQQFLADGLVDEIPDPSGQRPARQRTTPVRSASAADRTGADRAQRNRRRDASRVPRGSVDARRHAPRGRHRRPGLSRGPRRRGQPLPVGFLARARYRSRTRLSSFSMA